MKWNLATLRPVVVVLCAVAGFGHAAHADVNMYGSPATWRLEDYTSGSDVVAWFTGSNCTNGKISFPAGTTQQEKNRFYAMVLTAKLNGKNVGVYYDNTSATCPISSFYTWND
jgi:hypothetical protein